MTSTLSLQKIFGGSFLTAVSNLFKPINIGENFSTTLIKKDGTIVEKSILLGEKNMLSSINPKSTYTNYPVIEELTSEGFYVGAITNFLEEDCAQGCSIGEAYIMGKDGFVLKINYETSDIKKQYLAENTVDLRENTVGVLYTTIPFEIDSKETFVNVFKYLMPTLKRFYSLQTASIKN